MSDLCSECGKRLEIGDWPFCPHGKFRQTKIFTPYDDIQLAERPVRIESARQLDKELNKRNLVIRNNEHLDDINHRRSRMGMPPTRV